MEVAERKSSFEYTGGNLCLDFANTVDNRSADHPQDLFPDYSRLLLWAQQAGMLRGKAIDQLASWARQSPASAQSVFASAIQLREAIYQVFSAIARRQRVPENALATLNRAMRHASEHARVAARNRHFEWEWVQPERSLDCMLWPIARAAAELLTSNHIAQVRQCASPTCSWLFLDRTKNHRRRWCDMKTCGNRDKARRYYYRQKAGGWL